MNKLKTVLLSMLVLSVVSLFVCLSYGQILQRTRRPLVQNQDRMFLRGLDLSDEQEQMLKKLREKQREIQDQFREKAIVYRTELQGLRENPEKNKIQIESLQDELFNLRIEQLKSQYEHSKEFRKVFTPEQLERMSRFRRFPMQGDQAAYMRSGRQGRLRRYSPVPHRWLNRRFPVRRWRR
jgi:Spy/CpxP family protein refolding chaperone